MTSLFQIRGITFWVVSLFFCVEIKAQGVFTQFQTGNSAIPDNSVYAVKVGPNGDVWVGTDNGLAHFDGNNWQVFQESNSGLPSNYVRSIELDDSGYVWVGTAINGMARYDGSVWTTFNTANSALPDDFVRSLGAIPGGGIWAGTTGGLVKFRNGVMQAYDFLSQGSESNNVASIAAVDTNIVWLGMVNGGLIRLSDTGFVDYTIYNSSLMDNTILGLKRENQDLWLATPANGLIYYWNLAFIAYHPFNSASPSASYNALDLDQAGGIWLASQDSGLVYYDRSIWLNFNTLNSPFPQNYVRTVAYDPVQDVVWAGTHSQGLVRVQRTGALGSVGPENSVDWSFYPQPATDHIWLRKSSPEQKEWVLMDLGGRPLDGGIWIDQELEVRVGNHPAGLYILQVDQEFRKVLIRP